MKRASRFPRPSSLAASRVAIALKGNTQSKSSFVSRVFHRKSTNDACAARAFLHRRRHRRIGELVDRLLVRRALLRRSKMYRPVTRATTEAIMEALRQAKGIGNRATTILSVSLRTLRRWMAEDHLETFAAELRAQHKAARQAARRAKPKQKLIRIDGPLTPEFQEWANRALEKRTRKARSPREPRPPKPPRVSINPFQQGPKLGPKPKHNLKESDPLASRSVSNRELRALGAWRPIDVSDSSD